MRGVQRIQNGLKKTQSAQLLCSLLLVDMNRSVKQEEFNDQPECLSRINTRYYGDNICCLLAFWGHFGLLVRRGIRVRVKPPLQSLEYVNLS